MLGWSVAWWESTCLACVLSWVFILSVEKNTWACREKVCVGKKQAVSGLDQRTTWLRSWLNSKPSYRSSGVPEETQLFQEKTEESPSGPENQIQAAENMRQRSRPRI